MIVATWVDDIIMASHPSKADARVKFDKLIGTEFEMSPWTSGQGDVQYSVLCSDFYPGGAC